MAVGAHGRGPVGPGGCGMREWLQERDYAVPDMLCKRHMVGSGVSLHAYVVLCGPKHRRRVLVRIHD
jgi:hypothetical protein